MVRRALTLVGLGLMLAAGIWWVIQPAPNAVPGLEPTFEMLYAPWISAGGLLIAALAGLFIGWRYQRVKHIICHGVTIRGRVVSTDSYDTNMHQKSSTSSMQTAPTYVYYVNIRYEMRGTEYQVRHKLPHSPSTYGIKPDGEVDLIVLPALPTQPLIRAVYLGQARC